MIWNSQPATSTSEMIEVRMSPMRSSAPNRVSRRDLVLGQCRRFCPAIGDLDELAGVASPYILPDHLDDERIDVDRHQRAPSHFEAFDRLLSIHGSD